MNKKATLRIIVGVSAALAYAVFCFWLSGYFFLKLSKMETWAQPSAATFSTYTDYKAAYGDQPHVKKALNSAGMMAFMAFALPVGLIAFVALKRPGRALYGASRLSTQQEAIAELSAPDGLLCGKLKNQYLCFGGKEHVLLEAPTRSGKGVGIIIPTLLTYNQSVVVLDIKQENWDKTSGFRAKHGHKCFLFNPACKDYRSHRWNPLGYVSDDYNFRIDDIQKIGAMLFPHDGKGDPFWIDAPRNIFMGICLYLMETPELPFTLGEVYRQSVKLGKKTYFSELAAKRATKGSSLHPQAVLSFEAFAGLSDNTAGSIMGTLQAKLSLWANPVIDAATAANDFDLRELRREKMSVYIGITPDNLDRLAFLVNLFLQQCFDLNTQVLPEADSTLKYTCLFLMDEATSIGKIPILLKGIAYVAGYGLRLIFIIQSTAQLVEEYGEAAKKTFMDNFALRIVFKPRNYAIAEEISKTLGAITETNTSKSRSRSSGKGGSSNSQSESAVKRALFWPEELMELGTEKAILIPADIRPFICNKIRYYKDKKFTSRLLGGATVPLLTLPSSTPPVDPLAAELEQAMEQEIEVTTPEQVAKLNLGNIRFINRDVKLPKPATVDDDPVAYVEEFLDSIFSKDTAA